MTCQKKRKTYSKCAINNWPISKMVDDEHEVVGSTNGTNYYALVLSTLNTQDLKPSASVTLHRHAPNILPPEIDSTVELPLDTFIYINKLVLIQLLQITQMQILFVL